MRRTFSFKRYLYSSALFLGISGILWGILLFNGLLGGYFPLFPAVPTFFFLLGALAMHYMHKIIDGARNRMVVHFMLLTIGKLLIDVLFVILGLLLVGIEHRMGFVFSALCCYLVSLLLSVRYAI